MATNTVIIDGAVPRTNRERSQRLLDYLLTMDDVNETDKDVVQWKYDLAAKPDDYEFWFEMEDEIIEAIEDRLPENMVVEIGLHCPGDVVIAQA